MGFLNNTLDRQFNTESTAPLAPVTIDGTASFLAATPKVLTIKDYEAAQIKKIQRFDGILIGGELAIVAQTPKNYATNVIQIQLVSNRSFSGNLTDEAIQWVPGPMYRGYPSQWYVKGVTFAVNGVPTTSTKNYTDRHGIQLITPIGGESVTVASGTDAGSNGLSEGADTERVPNLEVDIAGLTEKTLLAATVAAFGVPTIQAFINDGSGIRLTTVEVVDNAGDYEVSWGFTAGAGSYLVVS